MKKKKEIKNTQEVIETIYDDADLKLSKKILNLCLWYQIEDSHNIINLYGAKIKMYEAHKQAFLNSCLFKFQSKKNLYLKKLYKNRIEVFITY